VCRSRVHVALRSTQFGAKHAQFNSRCISGAGNSHNGELVCDGHLCQRTLRCVRIVCRSSHAEAGSNRGQQKPAKHGRQHRDLSLRLRAAQGFSAYEHEACSESNPYSVAFAESKSESVTQRIADREPDTERESDADANIFYQYQN
jgi:hypothetical protein